MILLLLADAEQPTDIKTTAQFARESLEQAFTQAYVQVIALMPNVLAVIVILIVGYVIARLVAKVVSAVSDKLGLHQIADRGGLVASMRQVGIKGPVNAVLGSIAFWVLMFVFLMAAFNVLGLTDVATAMQIAGSYVRHLFKAGIVVVIGLLAATFVRGVVATSADRGGISYAKGLASACYYVLVVMTLMAGFAQLEIQFELLNYAILIVLGGLSIAFGLAVGFGGREIVSGILSGYYLRQRIQAGDVVTIGDLEGTVREIGPVATIVETEKDGLMNRRSIPNTKMLTEAVR